MANKRKLSEIFLQKLKPQAKPFLVWDDYRKGLAVRVQPTGQRAWKCIYSFHGRPRWYHIGNADAIDLSDARKLAARVMFQVAEGKDPAADKQAERSRGTFAELATQYVEQYAKKKNKSWQQGDKLIRGNVLPRWGKLLVGDISRSDVNALMSKIESPSVANQTLAAVSAIFSWAVREEKLTVNPCHKVERNDTQSRDRVLSNSEIRKFWAAFDEGGLIKSSALKMILLTGQRPGEVAHMRREHIDVDGSWTMPGSPDPKLGWPGTKNGETHRVWLPKPAVALLDELDTKGLVFPHVEQSLRAVMRDICKKLGVDRAVPHDLRRTFRTKGAECGFTRDDMNRIMNHRDRSVDAVYDRYKYSKENTHIMETIAARILALVEGRSDNVIAGKFGR